jgi:hypothetical protein
MLRAGLVAVALCVVAVISSPYRLQRVISYVDPNYTKIEMIDRAGVCTPGSSVPHRFATRVISRSSPRSPWEPRRPGRRAHPRQAEADVPSGSR